MKIFRKLVAVGDYCGKTFIIQTFVKDELPEPRLTFVSWDITDVEANGTLVELHIWDTCSKECYETSRISTYNRADVFLVFFSIFDKRSLENVEKQWVSEVRKFGPKDVPILLVGTHCNDLPVRSGRCVTQKEAEEMAKLVNAVGYVECNVNDKFNVEEVFVKAVAATLDRPDDYLSNCDNKSGRAPLGLYS